MAATEIYTIRKKDGRFMLYDEAWGAFRGAMLIWKTLEERYLPSLPLEDYMRKLGWTYHSRFDMSGRDKMDEIWNLQTDPRLTWQERIVFATCSDFAIIRTEDLPEVADAYENIDFASDNMKKQAEIMRRIYNEHDKTIGGIYKLETSVCCIDDFAHQKRSGYCYLTSDFYDVMLYLRNLKSVNYDTEKLKELYPNG